MKKEFKVGDRVKLRGYYYAGNRVEGLIGTLLNQHIDGDWEIETNLGSTSRIVTESQLIRLVRKQVREFEASKNEFGIYGIIPLGEGLKSSERIRVREVREKK